MKITILLIALDWIDWCSYYSAASWRAKNDVLQNIQGESRIAE